jgi:hypothetical protein
MTGPMFGVSPDFSQAMADIDRRWHTPTQAMPWSKTELPSYEAVKAWFLANEHTMGMFSLLREENIFQFWNTEYIACLASELQSLVGKGLVLEVCAGDGCLTHWLKEHGVNAVATDDYSWEKIKQVFPVEKLDALTAIDRYKPKLVIASWIDYDKSLDLKIIQKGVPYFVVIGEGQSGCTGSEEFWEKYEYLGYTEMRGMGKCDKWNISRTDYSMLDNDLHHHCWTTFLH